MIIVSYCNFSYKIDHFMIVQLFENTLFYFVGLQIHE